MDKFKANEEESQHVLKVLIWAVDEELDRIFKIFFDENHETFCENSYFNLLKHLKLKEIKFLKSNFGDFFFILLVKKVENCLNLIVKSIKMEDQIQMQSQMTKNLDFIFFILFKCSEVLGHAKNLPIENICIMFLKVFPKLELIKQITLVTKVCFLMNLYEKKFPNLSTRLRTFLLTLYLENFNDSEIRIFIACNILEFASDNVSFVQTRLVDFYTLKYSKRAKNFTLSQSDYFFLENSIINLNEKQASKINDINVFFEFISGSFAWQFIFFHPLYVSFINRFLRSNSNFEKQFLLYWEHFFNKILDCSHNIIKGNKAEFADTMKLECVPNIHLLKMLLQSKNEAYIRCKFVAFCSKLETHICEYYTKIQKKTADAKSDYNVYFKTICELMNYKLIKFPNKNEEIVDLKSDNIDNPKKDESENNKKWNVREKPLIFFPKIKKRDHSKGGIDHSCESMEIAVEQEEYAVVKSCIDFKNECLNDSRDNFKPFLTKIINKNKKSKVCSENKLEKMNDFEIQKNYSKQKGKPKSVSQKHKMKKGFPGILFYREFSQKMRNSNQIIERKNEQQSTNSLKRTKRLGQKIEKQMNLHGNSLFAIKKDRTSFEFLRKNIDTEQIMCYPITFNMNTLSALEIKALLNNFQIHKHLMLFYFRKYSNSKMIVINRNNVQSIEQKLSVMNVSQFMIFVKSLSVKYNIVETKNIFQIIKFINKRYKVGHFLTDSIVFDQFKFLLFQFAYLMHSGPLNNETPFECFCDFMQIVKTNIGDLTFENDKILKVGVDKNLVGHYQQIVKGDYLFELPINFKTIQVVEYFGEEINQNQSKKEARIITESILNEIILSTFEIRMSQAKIFKRTFSNVVQIKSIDYQFKENTLLTNIENSDRQKNVLKKPKIPENLAKSKEGNDFLHKKYFKMIYNPIDDLPLNLKLLVLKEQICKKTDLLEVSNLIEQMIKKVEILAIGRPVKLNNGTGKILNAFEEGKNSLAVSYILPPVNRRSVVKLNYRNLKVKKKVEKEKSKSQSKIEKKTKINFEKIAEIEKFKQFIKEKKKNDVQKKLEKENQMKQEIKEVISTFKNKSVPKLQMYIRNSQQKGQEKIKKNSKKSLPLIPPLKNLQILDSLHKINISQKKSRELFWNNLNLFWEKKEIQEVLTDSKSVLFDLFAKYASKFCNPDLIQTREIHETFVFWSFREVLFFVKEQRLYPTIYSSSEIKRTFTDIMSVTQAETKFGFEQFKFFILHLHLKIIEKKGEREISIWETEKLDHTIRLLLKNNLARIFHQDIQLKNKNILV